MAKKKIAYDSEITRLNHDFIDELKSVRNQSDAFQRIFDVLVEYEESGGKPGDPVYSLIERMIERSWDTKEKYLIPEVHAFVQMFKALEAAKVFTQQHRAIQKFLDQDFMSSKRFLRALRKLRNRIQNKKRMLTANEWIEVREMRSAMLDQENEFMFLYKSTQKFLASRYKSMLSKAERQDIVHEVILDRLVKADYNLALTVPQKFEFIKRAIKTQVDSYLGKKETENEYIRDARSFMYQHFPFQKPKKPDEAA